MTRTHALAAAALLFACGACSKPPAPPTEQKPDPQAAQLREAIQRPLDQAQAAADSVQTDAAKQQAEIDAAQ